MSAPLLHVQDLRVEIATRHAPQVALDGVTFHIEAGEVLGMVGESGAGKSLTGSALAGLLQRPARIAGGSIHFDGRRIDDLPERALRALRGRHIATIFQDPLTALDPLFTVGEQLVETLQTHFPLSATEARRRAVDLLAETGIPNPRARLADHPHQFSGGMRQRVVIALALAGEPRLLVADEPTTALDVSVQAQVIALLQRLSRERGLAVLLITHDLGVVATVCDRVAVLYAGRVAEQGPVDAVVHAPAHPYTVGLMGAIPRLSQGPSRLVQIDGAMPRLDAVPPGCAFHPRCPRAFAPCSIHRPRLLPAGPTSAACWLHQEPPR